MLAPMLPDNAPFSPEQRAWLSGFFAGILSFDGDPAAPEMSTGAVSPPQAAPDPLHDGDDGEAPWHDQTLPMDERMILAEGRPLRRKMMAAMAQQDCGQCGYSCEDYSNALFLGEESRQNLCVPGGKATARMLKKLAADLDSPAETKPADAGAPAPAAEPGRSRETPVPAALVSSTVLNKAGSEKETCHIEIDLSASGLDYEVGDSLGVLATNEPNLVDAVIAALGAIAETEVGVGNGQARQLRQSLTEDYALGLAPDALFELLAGLASDADEKSKLSAMAEGEDPDGDLETLDVLAVLEKYPHLKPDVKAFLAVLEPMQPRLYSISSSIKANPGRVNLTVDTVRYRVGDRQRLGVVSTFLADRLEPGGTLPVYVQKAHDFALPLDGEVPIIMIGPGTGVAPFRAFLQERSAAGATGGAWLFFGHQRQDTDFFYEEEFASFQESGTLTRLSTAFSRDQDQKIYVQDRMREEGAEVWRWLESCAHLYVCGDAKRMAGDVEKALIHIVMEHGGCDKDAAKAFVSELAKAGRYQRDVY